ncbi:FAD-dependent monooxygenase [Natronobacterium gregoryi]|uniref:Flavin-dependent dehydrogenase n=2 Tax=Natronobacterium gregoryi TaxID=44930 RepID=L0AER8_NATGS|nr:FAD-dependent monooxygenase [Natronobacterium gregoryi]AFZ71602.1 flavin-dependent dehydrogenase [Natronobacterium gregoryi SP2]ELY66657.1 monooxygenase FAD-binding protein [Natronobacterium gregoryi SP2]PLK21369.1 flavoprotein [Natronobacterium gregoryi SP2]SFI80720.1 electron transfer flavoprotein-quinone oxidoreductase [Natronobacterium gregoryi]
MSADVNDREHYEAVVVGCGPGGAAAAARLAAHDVETLVLERGTEAGSKNVSGGLIYAENSAPYTIDDLFDGFREEATERPATDYRIHNVAGNSVKTYDLTDLHEHDTDWCDAVLRRKMDSWLQRRVHEKTSETGGGVLTNVCVDSLLRENGEIVGVTCDDLDPIEADMIVAADGVNSELARDAGLMDWEEPEEWFQGVKAVVDMEPDVIDDRFDLEPDEGVAHLFSGDLFEDVRGGGFLYTNEDSLSIGTVFHLDSLVEQQAEPHELLDALLTHPMMAQWLGDEYEEREYAAKLVPDSKKVAHPEPYRDRLVLVGDAAGQMQAQGPIIKGMNHAVTAGALAADAFAVTRGNADPEAAGRRYAKLLADSGTMDKLRPRRYELARAVGERDAVTTAVERVLESPVGSLALGNPIADRLLQRAFNSPFLLAMLPDTKTGYVTIPSIIGEEHGRTIRWETGIEPPSLEERIGDLTYDTDVGNPHIELQDESDEASGTAVYACPVSAEDFGGGCYRSEAVKRNGTTETVVSLDTQPCVECGTCAIVADTDWEHPRGGKGVEYREG